MKNNTINIEGTAEERKMIPLYRGLLCYFPDALVEVAKQSVKGHLQHSPGEDISNLRWIKEKSSDELDAMMRHTLEGDWAAMAWRALAHLQRQLDEQTHNRTVNNE